MQQDFSPLDQTKSADDVQKVEEIKEKHLKINSSQCTVLQIDAINCIIEDTKAIFDFKLPKGSKKKNERGRPKSSSNKPKKKDKEKKQQTAKKLNPKKKTIQNRSTRKIKREPSRFEHVDKKMKTENKQAEKN